MRSGKASQYSKVGFDSYVHVSCTRRCQPLPRFRTKACPTSTPEKHPRSPKNFCCMSALATLLLGENVFYTLFKPRRNGLQTAHSLYYSTSYAPSSSLHDRACTWLEPRSLSVITGMHEFYSSTSCLITFSLFPSPLLIIIPMIPSISKSGQGRDSSNSCYRYRGLSYSTTRLINYSF